MKKTTQPTIVKGYKVTDPEMKCRGFQYELNKEYKHTGKISPCNSGFHFCALLVDCFEYYSFDPKNRVFEVEATGEVIPHNDKYVSDNIKLIRELTWIEVLTLVNVGKDNTGRRNSGDSNSGYRNSGNWNSGDSNSGDRNSGDSNSGYRNSGNWNSGDRNSGDSNSGYRNSGAFCTDANPKLILFDKVSKMTVKEWEEHPVCKMMYSIDTTLWVPWNMMSEEEKKDNPKYEASEGYTKQVPIKEAWANFWGNLADDKKQMFLKLENFNAKKFEEITGIKVK